MRTPTRSTSALGAVLLLGALLAGCGSRSGGGSGDASARPAQWHGCTAADVRRHGRQVAVADLDADGRPERVYLLAGGAPCRGLVALTRHGVLGVEARNVDPGRLTTLRLHGDPARDLVLATGTPHPRGGMQPRLYGVTGTRFGEVTRQGQPVLPFYATDGGGTPTTATCTGDGGIAVLTATTHQPPGIVLAWDVRRTTYEIRGLRAVRTGTRLVEEAAADPLLRKERPELFDGSVFTDCAGRAQA